MSRYPPVNLDIVSSLKDMVEVADDLGGEVLSCCWFRGKKGATYGEELGVRPAHKTAIPSEPERSLKGELEEEEESLLDQQMAVSLWGYVHWDEQSTDGEESEEELEV